MDVDMMNTELNEMQRAKPDMEEAKMYLSNQLLDKLTKTNVYTYYIVYSILISCFAYLGLTRVSWYGFIIALLSGMMIWTLAEYLIHRFLFHWKSSNPAIKLITFMFHGVHHTYPRDVPRSITPLMFTLPTATVFYIIFKFIFGAYGAAVIAGFALGYVLYSIIHDSTHHFGMNLPILKQLKKHHMRHHYLDISQNFGVSTVLWDILLGTYENKKTAKNI
jgi:dihydroceramide fatty acyl 2-hydroxylase